MKQINQAKLQEAIGKATDYTLDFDYLDIVKDIVTKLDDIENATYEDIYDQIDMCVDYEYQQWTIMKHHQRPVEANIYEAINSLATDILDVCDYYKELVK